jgi:AcrR family transcriptional regulator
MEPVGLREAKRLETSHELARAAFDLAMERGVDDFTIDDIVDRAGYSRRTFANHYSCKEEAIAALALENVRRGIATLPETPDDVPLLDWLVIMARHQMSTGQLSLLTQLRGLAEQSRTLQPHLSEVERQIRRAVYDEVRIRPGHDLSPISIQILVGAVYGAITMALDGEVPLNIPGSDPENLLSIDDFLEITVNHLRNGF